MTRCRPTDTALVIADEHAENIGTFVTVLSRAGQGIGEPAVWLCQPSAPLWGVVDGLGIVAFSSDACVIRDDCLQPIRGAVTPQQTEDFAYG